MAESELHKFPYKDVATALIKHAGIKEGIWAVYVEFGLGAGNVASKEGNLVPVAFVPVTNIGLRRAETIDDLSVDAAAVNHIESKPGTRKRNPPAKRA